MPTVNDLHPKAMDLAELAFRHSRKGDDEKAKQLFLEALRLEQQGAMLLPPTRESEPSRSILYRSAASLAFNAGDYETADWLIANGLAGFPPPEIREELKNLYDDVNFMRHLTAKGMELAADLAAKAVFVELINKEQIRSAVRDWPVTPMRVILFGGERLMWASWGAIARREAGQVVGLATVGDEGEGDGQPGIIGIMVLPDYRRQGIGRTLLAAVVEEARQRDLLPLRYDALTLSGLALAQAAGYSPAELEIRDFTLGGTIGWLELK